MSLYIGNLPSEAHPSDLERVFQKYGRCTIKMKDRYGFVVFDNPSSAENALRTLRGARICGQIINLSWSNQQPRTSQRSGRGDKLYDPPRKRYFMNDNAGNYGRGYGRGFKNTDGEVRNNVSSHLFDPHNGYSQDESKARMMDRDESPLNDSSNLKVAVEDQIEDDRWEEHLDDISNENFLENSAEFDTFEPSLSDDRKEHQKTSSVPHIPPSRKRHDIKDADVHESDNSPLHKDVDYRDKKRSRRRFESPDDNEANDSNLHSRKEKIDSMNAQLFGEQAPVPDSNISRDAHHEAKLSSNELFIVMKHYGLKCPEKEVQLPVELLFGSSRLWPWEVIYYRRWRKRNLTNG